MEAARQTWTDDRLDDLSGRVDRLSDRMDEGFQRVDADLRELNRCFDALQRTLLQVGWTMVAAVVGLVATQL